MQTIFKDEVAPIAAYETDDFKEFLDKNPNIKLESDVKAEDIKKFSVPQLRLLIQKSDAYETGSWVASARKSDLVAYLAGGSTPQQKTAEATSGGIEAALLDFVQRNGAVDESEVKEIVSNMLDTQLDDIIDMIDSGSHSVTKIELVDADGVVTKDMPGMQHKQMSQMIAALTTGWHVCMFGESGGGKTYAAKQFAEANDWPFQHVTYSPTTPISSLMGYADAEGNYVASPLYMAVTQGHMFIADEVDNWNPNLAVALNTALDANGTMSFPGVGKVNVHPDFQVVACANTPLGGGRDGYERLSQDAAFKNRFSVIEWQWDEDLERAVAVGQLDFSHDNIQITKGQAESFVTLVQRIRQAVSDLGIRDIKVTPRATIEAIKMVALHGSDWIEDALEMRVFQTDDREAIETIRDRIGGFKM